MPEFLTKIGGFFLNLFFPTHCLNCQREGDCLCEDCLSLIEMAANQYCPFCRPARIVLRGRTCNFCRRAKKLDGLYSAAPYQNFIIKKAVSQFKYEPYVRMLSKPLASLIIKHFRLFEQEFNWLEIVLIPVPLTKKKQRSRGFNQAQELARELSVNFRAPLLDRVLIKTKETLSQVELSGKEREGNVRDAFLCANPEAVRGKKILLVDDVFTTGSTMEECARVLKNSGAREVWGVVVARE